MNKLDATKPLSTLEFRRLVKAPGLGHEADAIIVEAKIGSLPGVRAVVADVKKHRVMVCYDVARTDYLTVIDALERAGFPPVDNWLSRRKRDWYKFTENNAKENAKAPPPACCNKPPK